MDATPFREWPRMYRSIAYWYVITFAVTLGQAGALVISLLSLAEESDYISRTLMAAFQGISIFFLTLSTGIMVRHKAWYKRLKKQKDP
jgi:hypothetical protein